MDANEIQNIKSMIKQVWMSGDYAQFAQTMAPGAMSFLRRQHIEPGMQMLDVGCGAGQIAIAAARTKVKVTGIDIAPNLLTIARDRALHEDVQVQFDEGDAEHLPYADESFDIVLSFAGAMFALRPMRVVEELLRVCRPGGRIVMANWTPNGFTGHLMQILTHHYPHGFHPTEFPSPLLWGQADIVKQRFKNYPIHLQTYHFPFHYPMSPSDVVIHYRENFGPVHAAFNAIDEERQSQLQKELTHLWESVNLATDGTTRFESEYLEVTVYKN